MKKTKEFGINIMIQFCSMKKLHHQTIRRLKKLSYRHGLLRPWLNERKGWVCIARNKSNRIVGWAAVVPPERKSRTFVCPPFLGVFVEDVYRNLGVGRRLVESLIRRTRPFLGHKYMACEDSMLFFKVMNKLGSDMKLLCW